MPTKTFHYTALALGLLEKILGSKFSVTGIDRLPKLPILFVANHFTRFETFVIPYLIYKNTGRQVRCLADSSLYHGYLGKFLESAGTISTKHKNRDNIILKDLITGNYDWMIYPEGSMVKSKEIRNEKTFINYTPYRVGPVRSGSAVLALKSQIYRDDIVDAYDDKNAEVLQSFQDNFGVTYQDYFRSIDTQIVPLNITYYPLRPGQNKLQKLVLRMIKNIPEQVSEELEIEGNLLLSAEVNINFGEPISLKEYIKNTKNLIYQIPVIKQETKANLILRYLKGSLTHNFMTKIYSDIEINFDHIFSAALYHFAGQEIRVSHLKRIIYLSAVMIQKSGKYRVNQSIFESNLYKIFLDEPNQEFDSVFKLAILQDLIKETPDAKIKINKKLLLQKYDFHEIRLKNSLQVVLNEFLLLELANNIIKRNVAIPDDELRKKVFTEIHNYDLSEFENDYNIYFDAKFSKDKSVGSPFFIESKAKATSKVKRIGILLVHGYKSAPKELEPLAQFFSGFGFKIYGARLKGHGTSPINLRDVTWHDWYDSTQRGYAALRNICGKIIMVGFSTGGLLSLVSAEQKTAENKKLAAIISINSALKLLDIKARMVPGINLWNEMLDKLNIQKGKFEYVDDVPENPQINYSRNYLRGVEELESLMNFCEKNLEKVIVNSLIIQADKDPVVNPISGKIIYNKIKSPQKVLSELDFANHVIINCKKQDEVFEVIRKFLYQLKFL
jgi:esterase/lipase/1-acyl-sn-glycerol-3-phosphate acyltransferase